MERKANCQELIGNIGTNFQTFQNELELMQQYKIKAIIVCGPNDFADLYDKGYTKIHPNFALKQLSLIHAKYQIPTIFLESRFQAEAYIFRLFKEILDLTKETE